MLVVDDSVSVPLISLIVTRESRRVVPVSPTHDERPPIVVKMGVP